MNLVETGRLLAKVSGNDGREVGEVTIRAWQEVLADVLYPDAMAAVTMHYRESTDFLMPAHVVRLAARVRAERVADERAEHRHARAESLGDVPPATRRAIKAVTGAGREHHVTIRRVELDGSKWAYSCTCGLNPVGQEWPDKDTARARSRAHIPTLAATG